ncbi:anti-sigma factor family protein [Undibacterium sp. Ji67W]|uniref:anti-sigma factor family protein n=1 Tax=Undibacterium sp. Ji67W TaxID=3413042 RepID=UPI003BF40AB4
MDCKQIQTKLSAYVDHELNDNEMVAISGHLINCATCQAELGKISVLGQTIQHNATRYAAPPALKAKIATQLSSSANLSAPLPAKRFRLSDWPWAWINFGLTGISSAAFAAMLVLYLGSPSKQEVVNDEVLASHFRSLTPGRLIDVTSSDQHTVKPWYAGKLDFSPPVHDLGAQNFRLLGGRIDYMFGCNVAALVYQRDKHIINVYVWPQERQNRQSELSEHSLRGYQIVQWTSSGMNYVAVSDLNKPELRQFSTAMTKAENSVIKNP